MPIPPFEEIKNAFLYLLAPGLSASLAVMLVTRLLGGQRLAPLASALALTAGVLAANYFRAAMSFDVEPGRPLAWADLASSLRWSLEGKTAEELEAEPGEEDLRAPDVIYWLPWLAGLAMVVGLLARLPGVTSPIGWTARTAVALFAGRLLTPAATRLDLPWAPWALALAILLEWAILEDLSRRWRDGTIAVGLALCFACAGLVLLHAHSAKLTDAALFFFPALLGSAILLWKWPVDIGGLTPAAAVFLPGLAFIGPQRTFSDVPLECFLLTGLATLALAPMMLPILARQERWLRWLPGIALPLLPALLAVYLAMQAESVVFK